MASLEQQIQQYTDEINEEAAKIDRLWTQVRATKEADGRAVLQEQIRSAEASKERLISARQALQLAGMRWAVVVGDTGEWGGLDGCSSDGS